MINLNENDIKKFKKDCWNIANRLRSDKSKIKEYFNWLSSIDKESDQKAIVWCVNAYYEYINGRWDKSRCEKQIKDAIQLKFNNKQ